MRKTFILLAVLISLAGRSQVFQSDLENWNGNVPANFVGSKTNLEADSIQKYSASAHSGQFAVQLINTESAHKRFTTQPLQVDSGVTYNISFWVRGKGNIRTGLYDGRTANSGYYYNTYITVNSTDWTNYVQSVTCEKNNSAGEFVFSIQLTNANYDHIQLDDVLITVDNPNAPSITITSPTNNALIYSSTVNIEFNVSNFVLGTDGKVKYTVNNGSAQYTVNSPIVLNGLSAGTYNVVLELVDVNEQSLNPQVTASVNFTVSSSLPQYVSIYDIQYTTDVSGNSPYVDDTVLTSGIVTGTYSQGFFMQNGYGPWNGIYVFSATYAPQVNVGDSISIVGKVKEYYGLTELTNISYLQVHSQNNPLPAPVIVTAASVKSEQYEGVLVKILNATCINPNAGYGMWTVQDNTDTCKIHNLLYSYTPILNNKYNITGPVYYAYSEYRIEPRSANDIQDVTGIDENIFNDVLIYPIPAQNYLNISSAKQINKIEIYTLDSKKVMEKLIKNSNEYVLNINNLKQGNYIAIIYFVDGTKASYKIQK